MSNRITRLLLDLGFYIRQRVILWRGPSKWDLRFLALAQQVALWSKDPRTRVGCVLVSPSRDRLVLGYNGLPRQTDDDPQVLGDRELKNEMVVHAEANALLTAACSTRGWTSYTTHPPCSRCTALLIQAGIQHMVYTGHLDERWTTSLARAQEHRTRARVTSLWVPEVQGRGEEETSDE